MRISPATLTAVQLAAGAARRPDERGAVTLVITVESGLACRLVQGAWDDPALIALAPRLLREIGYKTIEHAPSSQAVIRCEGTGRGADAVCRIDLGNGFEPLPILDEGEPDG